MFQTVEKNADRAENDGGGDDKIDDVHHQLIGDDVSLDSDDQNSHRRNAAGKEGG